jgi:hypothetical protein
MDGPQITKIVIDELIIKQFDSIIMKVQLLDKRFSKLHNQISST